MRLALLLPALLAAGLAGASFAKSSADNPAWMAGEWNMMSADEPKRFRDCNSDHSDWFDPDGKFTSVGDATGRWSVKGDKLIMVTTDPGDGNPEAKGEAYTIRFKRVAPDELRFSDGEGQWKMVRCPDK
ncbi:MAG TPA: hypothetical protein VF589_04175 [Allosphingosinicella sp.]|jgi:hypothetical protein